MALTYSKPPEMGTVAPDFKLPATDGKTYSLKDFSDTKGLCVIFMCNHCPYVIAVQDRINELAKRFAGRGIQVIGINSNNVEQYPQDSFDAMKTRAIEKQYVFPYLFDETQEVAKAYDAACTPDPFFYENVGGKFLLRYHGRIDDNWKEPSAVTREELADAFEAVLSKKLVNSTQNPAMGCNIKWK